MAETPKLDQKKLVQCHPDCGTPPHSPDQWIGPYQRCRLWDELKHKPRKYHPNTDPKHLLDLENDRVEYHFSDKRSKSI